MRTSQLATLVAAAAISLPLLAYTASAVDASPHTAPAVGKQLAELRGSGPSLETVSASRRPSRARPPSWVLRARKGCRSCLHLQDDRLHLEPGG